MKKRVLSLLLILILVTISVAACGGSKKEEPEWDITASIPDADETAPPVTLEAEQLDDGLKFATEEGHMGFHAIYIKEALPVDGLSVEFTIDQIPYLMDDANQVATDEWFSISVMNGTEYWTGRGFNVLIRPYTKDGKECVRMDVAVDGDFAGAFIGNYTFDIAPKGKMNLTFKKEDGAWKIYLNNQPADLDLSAFEDSYAEFTEGKGYLQISSHQIEKLPVSLILNKINDKSFGKSKK